MILHSTTYRTLLCFVFFLQFLPVTQTLHNADNFENTYQEVSHEDNHMINILMPGKIRISLKERCIG